MSKLIYIGALALTVFGTNYAIADDEWTEDAKAFAAQQDEGQIDQAENDGGIELAQWRQTWTCFARSRDGRVFTGTSVNNRTARQVAMNRCFRWSRSCWIRTCR